MVMFRMLKKFGGGLVRNRLATAMLLVVLAASIAMLAAAQAAETERAPIVKTISTSIIIMSRCRRKRARRG